MNRAHKRSRRLHIYQVRVGLGDDPTEILTRLTHHVWQMFRERGVLADPNPHLWPVVFRTFRDAFKNRLSYNPQCGHYDHCRAIPCILCGRTPHRHEEPVRVYLLEIYRPLSSFLSAVSGALARSLRWRGARGPSGEPPVRALIRQATEEALQHHFFVSDVCTRCPMRESLADRRVWARESLEVPWGAWRGIIPGELG